MTVSIVIPVREATARLTTCLEALKAQRVSPDQVIVLCARTRPPPAVQARWPQVQFLRCPPPASFCRAVNHGIAATRAPWVLVLNDDVTLAPDFLEQLFTHLPSDERIGMACGKMLSADGSRIDAAGQFLSRARTARDRGHGSPRIERFNTPGFVFCAPGSAALYRRRMLEALTVDGQYFDERFGCYLEDLDLGWRAQQAGWRAYYVPQATARHVRGATAKTRAPAHHWLRRYYLPQLAPRLQARYVLNRYRLMAAHDTWLRLLRDLPWIIGYEAALWSYLLVCEPKTVRLICRAMSSARGRGR